MIREIALPAIKRKQPVLNFDIYVALELKIFAVISYLLIPCWLGFERGRVIAGYVGMTNALMDNKGRIVRSQKPCMSYFCFSSRSAKKQQ
jgi:hypothetical protein